MRSKQFFTIRILFCILAMGAIVSCKQEAILNPNAPTLEEITKNPTIGELNNLVTGTEAGMRQYLDVYYDVTGVIGREFFRYSSSEPRYTSDFLGGGSTSLDNTSFYVNNSWIGRGNVIRNAYILMTGAKNSKYITANERLGYNAFAKTIIAYELILALNQTYGNGIRTNLADFNNLGPIVTKDQALTDIIALLNEAKTDLATAEIVFELSIGFEGLKDEAGFLKFNRAIAARAYTYASQWANAKQALSESFFDPNGDFATGAYHVFSTAAGDVLNPVFFARNRTGDVRAAHASFVTDIAPNDDRISKVALRTNPFTTAGLTSSYDFWIYKTNTAPLPIIRNEELILIKAEVEAQLNNLPDAEAALNIIRTKHGLTNYAGAVTQQALINEMLYQKRYSLYGEGFRWVDLRRYNKLGELPIDRAGDDVWVQTPLPFDEQ